MWTMKNVKIIKYLIFNLNFNKKNLATLELTKQALYDKHNRFHDYLRISLTERCNLRCLYCMPEEGVDLTPKSNILTIDEIFKLSSQFVKLGVRYIRFTGGEPLVRKDVIEIIETVNSLKTDGLEKIRMTTNGITLSSKIDKLIEAGLNGVNISLDTLIPSKYELITRRKGFEKVWKSITNCLEKQLDTIKINCVIVRGINDDEICDFVRLTRNMPIDIRFIEYMPFGGNKWDVKKMVSYAEMLSRIKDENIELNPEQPEMNSTSKMFKVSNWLGRIGFITSNTMNFCNTCNRLRITADGNLKVCLHGISEVSLRNALRSGKSDEDLTILISDAVKKKKSEHADFSKFLSHVNEKGQLNMVDISEKYPTNREASASCFVKLQEETLIQIQNSEIKKGDVLTVAKIAGIQAAKRTSELIPLCHQIRLSKVEISCELSPGGVLVKCRVVASQQKTGVEMECIVGVTVAAITIFDMCKAIDKNIIINSVQVDYKIGGKNDFIGNY